MPTPPNLLPELNSLAKDCAALLREHEALIGKFRELMLQQRMTREQAESINPFMWATEVCTQWALKELE